MALFLYRLVLYLTIPLLAIRFLWRAVRDRRYTRRIGERFGFSGFTMVPGGFWVHAVSVGEVNAAIPLVNRLREQWPEKNVTVTTMTVTGSDRVLQVFGDTVQHCYLPYDYPGAMARFLTSVQPEVGLIMETEIWPNMIALCDKKKIPLIYANVRLSEKSFNGYAKFRSLLAPLLKTVSRFAVQSAPDAARLARLGAHQISIEVTGSLKFDTQIAASVIESGHSIRRQLGQERNIVVVASTHEGEEEMLLSAYLRLREKIENLLFVVVPRHPERFDRVFRLCQKKGVNAVKRSQQASGHLSPDVEVVLVDLMGQLPQFIAAGDITFMGGSLVSVGGHNLLEPAALGKPVIFGPHMYNFAEISRMMLETEGGLQIQSISELDGVLIKLFDDSMLRNRYASAGQKLVQDNKGALDRVAALLESVLLIKSTDR